MTIYLTLYQADDPEGAKPLLATRDKHIIEAVVRELISCLDSGPARTALRLAIQNDLQQRQDRLPHGSRREGE